MEQSTETVARTNEDWLADLTAEVSRQETALSELRGYLRRGLFAFLREDRSDLARRDSEDVGQMAEDFAQEALLKILDGLSTSPSMIWSHEGPRYGCRRTPLFARRCHQTRSGRRSAGKCSPSLSRRCRRS